MTNNALVSRFLLLDLYGDLGHFIVCDIVVIMFLSSVCLN